VFWVISVYFNIRNTLPKSGTFLLGHPVYIISSSCITQLDIFYVTSTSPLPRPSSDLYYIKNLVKNHTRNLYYYYYYYYYYYLLTYLLIYLLQLSCHSVAVVLTLVQTKQIRINILKRNNTKTQYKQHKTQWIQVHILPKHPQNCQYTPTYAHPHILQNKLKQPQYQIHTKWNSRIKYNKIQYIYA